MTVIALGGFLLLLVGVPVLLVNRRAISRSLRRRRHRHQELPFLFIPMDGPGAPPPPVPAWRLAANVAEQGLSVAPEPGIADLPPSPDQDEAAGEGDLLPRDMDRPVLWDRTVPFEPGAERRLGRDD